MKRIGNMGVYIYYDDHNPPHFHARLAGREAKIDIGTLTVQSSSLSKQSLGRVLHWASHHPKALANRWDEARKHQPLRRIP